MSTTVAPLGLRLFLEGIEVPAISAQVTITPDQPSVAAIQVVPSEMAMHLLPRTLVHLFYLDDEQLNDPTAPPRQQDNQTENNFNRFEAPDAQYKLLFSGEVIGFNYGKAADTRQLVLQCMDLSSYWDTCYQWYADWSVGGNALTDKMHVFVGAGKTEFNSVSGGTQWVIGEHLNSKPRSPEYQKVKGLLGGIISLLEAIGGLRYKSSKEPGVNGVNDFFTIAELRYNLLGMVGAVEEDDTSAKLYASKAFISWLRNGMTSLGNLLSFRDVINHVDRFIFHHVYPNPCAYFKEGKLKSRLVDAEATQYSDTAEGQLVRNYLKLAVNSIRDAYRNVSDDLVLSVPTTYMKTKKALGSLDAALAGMEVVKSDDSKRVKAKIKEGQTLTKKALAEFKDLGFDEATEKDMPGFYEESRVIITQEEMNTKSYRNQVKAAKTLNGLYPEILDLIGPDKGILSTQERSTTHHKQPMTSVDGAHLYSQLIFPETFFVAPPRCNVLFPDQYYQFSFSRNFMREITRLSATSGLGFLGGNGGPSNALLSSSYYAPNIQDVRKSTMYASMSKGSTVLLPHEVHSGIIPKFEWVSDGNRWAAKASKDSGQQDEFYRNGKVGYLQRLANFQFFLHRWSSRSMTVTGIFNPNIVLGLPGVVLDRSLPSPEVVKIIEQKLGRKWLPIQYLGKVVYISHSIHQQGGMTQVSYSHCRMHRGFDDEFLGVLVRQVENTVAKKVTLKFQVKPLLGAFSDTQGSKAQVTGENAEKFPPMSADDLKKILELWITKELRENQKLSAPASLRNSKVLKVVAGKTFMASDTELIRIGITGVEKETAVPETLAIDLEFQLGTGKYHRTSTSIESALTPSWYSDVWKNKNIGEKVYQPLLGIGAITDWVGLQASQQSGLLDQTFVNEANEAQKRLTATDPAPGENPFTLYQDPTGVRDSQFNANPGSIEEAIDSLTILYGLMKNRGADLHEFIKSYTKRPVANLEQVLGSANLAYDARGRIDSSIQGRVIEGFHSRAFGDYNAGVNYGTREGERPQPGKDALVGFFPGVANPGSIKRKNLIQTGVKPASIPPYYDPRGRSRARVRAYVQELQLGRGLLG